MSHEAFAPPEAESAAEADGWVIAAAVLLSLLGGFNVAFGAVLGPLYYLIFQLDPAFASDPALRAFSLWLSVVIGLLSVVFATGYAVIHWAVALGLLRRGAWAWYGGLVLGAMYLPSCFLPASALVMYAMLRPPTRRQFLGW